MEGALWSLCYSFVNSSQFLAAPAHLLWMSPSYALSPLLAINLHQLGKQQIDWPV